MDNDQLLSVLKKIGLNQLETSCYQELLRKSPQRASDLARKLSLPKATILTALYTLSDTLGIIKRTKQKNSFLFLVEDVKDLMDHVARKEAEAAETKKEVESLLPELRGMQNFDAVKPHIIYMEGKDGLKQAFEQVLEDADEIIGYGSNEDDVKYLPELYPNYYERRVKKKIPVKAIIPATPFNVKETKDNSAKQLRNTHLIPAEFNYPIQVNIYKHTVAFYSFEESFVLLIKSKPIAKCLKKIFELAFDQARVTDNQIKQA